MHLKKMHYFWCFLCELKMQKKVSFYNIYPKNISNQVKTQNKNIQDLVNA